MSNRSQPPHADSGESFSAPHSDQSFPVVAIGASAGGLEAFSDVLQHIAPDTGMAFVFIQHLAPSHQSMLAELLARKTAMPVGQVEDGTVLSPNHVYVIPPNASMTVSGAALTLSERVTAGVAIDVFLRSLAVNRKSAAVAVILSGTGSDGALGVQAIAEEGGTVLVQDPGSAKFDGMPRSAIANGHVDFVLPPEGIAAELSRIAREPRLLHPEIRQLIPESPDSEKEFEAILDLLGRTTGIDFNLYRSTTIKRRVLRRMGLLRLGSLHDYLTHTQENPDELHALAQDVLIRVTRFFRDPECFAVLGRRVFPALIRKAPKDRSVRIWVPGCSTGEEAYSIAICFLEVAEQMESRIPLQVFATDINEAAIAKARRGAYIENIVADVSPERLARYFVRAGREFHISRRLRDQCVFSQHDVLNDPPFSRMDLVSCRNVLIYLDSMKEFALSRFHFALNPGGFLLLGKSETASSSPELFAPLDKQAKLYVRQESATHRAQGHGSRTRPDAPHRQRELPAAPRLTPAAELRRQADRLVLARYGPQWAIVDENLEPLGYGDNIGGLEEAGPDGQDQTILEAIKSSAAEALRNAVREAGEKGQAVRIEAVRFGEGPTSREVSLEITPLEPDHRRFLVVLEQRGEHGGGPGELQSSKGWQSRTQIARLEKALAQTRSHLESVIVEQETAHEEVVASNEELQSLNEELESSKEELEATNEELTTVNQELDVRNGELESAREFAQATVDTVRGALLVLGPDLRVLKANQSFYKMFRLPPEDVERHFVYELADGRWSNADLRKLLEEILPKRRRLEDFEIEQELPSGGRRILLLNAHRFEREERILLAIEDVTESRRLEQDLRQSQKMEAVGYLAAGVAHDFNNLLTGIMGNASLALDSLPESDPSRAAIESVIGGSQRAADLTRQLLAYAGKGRFYAERVDLSEVVIQTGRLIQPSIRANVQLRLDLDKHLPLLLADVGQMQQVVMNLVINAVEAIGEAPGAVLVTTGQETVGGGRLPDLFPKEELKYGDYVFLEVQDNGAGMDQETVQRIFDPFYTTKFTGRGLGLAAVLGIVRQHKGGIQVHSVPGRGSSFRVLFPVTEKFPSAVEDDEPEDLRGTGTVLVVDDEEMIRSYASKALEPFGYTVLLARDGQEAIRLIQERAGEIGLILLDVAMPGLDGPATLERIRSIRDDIPVIVSSGFGDLDIEKRFAGQSIAAFFPKPYTIRELASKVKAYMRAPRS